MLKKTCLALNEPTQFNILLNCATELFRDFLTMFLNIYWILYHLSPFQPEILLVISTCFENITKTSMTKIKYYHISAGVAP